MSSITIDIGSEYRYLIDEIKETPEYNNILNKYLFELNTQDISNSLKIELENLISDYICGKRDRIIDDLLS
jgi:hypothetical protein